TPSDSSGMTATQVGTMAHLENVLADQRLPDGKLTQIIDKALGRPAPPGDFSANYIEVQVHGPIELKTDVARLVVNAQYKGNATYEPKLRQFAAKLGVELEWTNGSVIFDDNSVPVNFAFPGLANVQAPAAPKDFTTVHYGDTVAYVPAVAGAAPPATLPRGYVAVPHPEAGTVLVPERFTDGGKLSRDVLFGAAATGVAAPVVPMGLTYLVPNAAGGQLAVDGPPAPKGYTVVGINLAGTPSFAFMPTAKDTAAPEAPFGMVAVPHPKAGTILLPKKFTTSGAFAPGLVFGPQLNGF